MRQRLKWDLGFAKGAEGLSLQLPPDVINPHATHGSPTRTGGGGCCPQSRADAMVVRFLAYIVGVLAVVAAVMFGMRR
jgi:hypothetical protein